MNKLFLIFSLASVCLSSCENKGPNTNCSTNNNLSYQIAQKLHFNQFDKTLQNALISGDVEILDFFREFLKESPEWLALVNKTHKLNPLWIPKDLINLQQAGVSTYRNDICLRAPVIEPLKKMIQEAQKDGIKLWVVSAYRDIAYQQRIWNANVKQNGLDYTQQYVAVPGTSQHHLGSVVDLNLADEAFDDTLPALWLKQNAHRFGFSLSYPKSYEKETGYSSESWHYRYFPEKILLFIQKYFNGLQFAFLEFWNRNETTIRAFMDSDCYNSVN